MSRMRVFNQRKGTKVALHMGRCQPKHTTGNGAGQASWSCTGLLMQAFTPSIRFMVYCAMALHKLIAPTCC